METVRDWNIMPKELLLIVIVAVVWGKHWCGLTVKACCDNMAVVVTIRSGSCKERHAMHLMRCLAFMEATVPFSMVAEHIRGEDNVVVDALSRDNIELTRSVMQESATKAEGTPRGLLELLMMTSCSWSEREWKRQQSFCSIRD